jgi:hypothetical protein
MGCNASKGPDQVGVVVVVDNDDEARNTGRVSILDFTTSTDFFRRSSLLLWKPQSSTSDTNKMSVFEEFKEQQHQQDQKHNDLVGCVVGGPLITSSSND